MGDREVFHDIDFRTDLCHHRGDGRLLPVLLPTWDSGGVVERQISTQAVALFFLVGCVSHFMAGVDQSSKRN